MVRPRVETHGFQIIPLSLNIFQCLAIEMRPLSTVPLIFSCNLKSIKGKWLRITAASERVANRIQCSFTQPRIGQTTSC